MHITVAENESLYDLDNSLENIVEMFKNYLENIPEEFRLSARVDVTISNEDPTYCVYYIRDETDTEMKIRKQLDAEDKKRKKEFTK